MWCYISLPNQQCIEIEVDPKQTGRVVLDKVLEKLGVLELDYFGLQYRSPKHESLWLNLRNRLCDHEIYGAAHVYRLSLRVKFFVQPHTIQQEKTKELFYDQVKDMMRSGLIALDNQDCDETRLAKIIAYICQAEHGDQTGNIYQNTLYLEILKGICPMDRSASPVFVEHISQQHSKLRGTSKSSARYFALKEVSGLPSYGRELHKATSVYGTDVTFAVGPNNIVLQETKSSSCRTITFNQIRLATHNEKSVHLDLINDLGETQSPETFKLRSRKAAVALYRCITEMHSFFLCDTVGSNVQSQYCRDFKGTFVSIFNENSELGKRYIFDIQRTRQEAYEMVRRKLYNTLQASPSHCPPGVLGPDRDGDSDGEEDACCDGELNGNIASPCEESKLVHANKNQQLQKEVKKLKRRIEHFENSLMCCICLDKQVCMVLCPCGHLTCDDCCTRIEQCPQCRKTVESSQKIYVGLSSSSKISKDCGRRSKNCAMVG